MKITEEEIDWRVKRIKELQAEINTLQAEMDKIQGIVYTYDNYPEHTKCEKCNAKLTLQEYAYGNLCEKCSNELA